MAFEFFPLILGLPSFDYCSRETEMEIMSCARLSVHSGGVGSNMEAFFSSLKPGAWLIVAVFPTV